eukprot:2502447-Pleurochrysis_carterae.AAC.1
MQEHRGGESKGLKSSRVRDKVAWRPNISRGDSRRNETHEHAYGVAAAAFCDQVDRAPYGSPER